MEKRGFWGLSCLMLLVLSVSVVSATTLYVNNNYLNERNTIVSAADRIVDLQNAGSWDWIVTDETGPTGTTYLNIAGVTAEVLLDAYVLTGDEDYLDAAEETGNYLITQMGSSTIDITKRTNAFNIMYLYKLGEISGDSSYTDKANALLQNTLHQENYWTSHNENYCTSSGCTAEQLLNAINNYRGGDLEIVMWDLFRWVEAAEMGGETTWADNLKILMDNSYSSLSSDSDYYIIGLSGLVLATGNSEAVDDLIDLQEEDGSWDDPNGVIQDTAYALAALNSVGESSAVQDASEYLMDEFGYTSINGWLESDDEEYSEITSEAAQALFYHIYVPDTYYTIKDAVTAASEGDTINVAAGIYDEQVVINKSLILQGAGDTTIVKPSSAGKLTTVIDGIYWDTSTKQIAGIVVINTTGANVIIKDIKVDGSSIVSKPTGADYVSGIFYRETSGTVDSVIVTDMIIGSTGTAVRGYGIYLSSATNIVNVEIKDSTITDYDKNGIQACGNKLTVNIHNNIITGRDSLPSGDEVQNGILIAYGTIASVNDNIISNMVYTPLDWWTTGILFIDSGSSSANGNTINNVQSGIIFQDGNGTAAGNTIDGGTVGLLGLWAQYTKAGIWTVSFVGNNVNKAEDSIGWPLPTLYQNGAIGIQSWESGASIIATIENNQITSTIPTTADGIYIGDIPAGSPAGKINITIIKNNISNWEHGIHLISSVSDANITKNIIKNNIGTSSGIHIESAVDANKVDVNYNKIFSNTNYGIFNNNIGILNATNNWWGSCDGPSGIGAGHGDSVSANVDYTPWIVKGVCITGKINMPCGAFETDNIILSANLTANETEMNSTWFSYTINGVNHNKTANYVGGNKYQIIIPSSELVGGKNMTWNVYANDSIKTYKNGEKTFYVKNKTSLTVNPLSFDGQNGWYVTEPEFSLIGDSHGEHIYYQWDSTGPLIYTAPFSLENIPNPPPETAGILGLKWWTDSGICGNETKQNKTFYIDLTDPQFTNLQPINGITVYNNLKPKIFVYIDDGYGSNSGINKDSIILKVDGIDVTSNADIKDADTIDANVSYIPISDLSEGNHEVYVYAEDNAGRSNETTWNFNIKISPVFGLKVSSPENKTYGERRILFNISADSPENLAKIEYIEWNDGKRWTRLCSNCRSYKREKTFGDGEHNITIRATDYYSQISEINIFFQVDSREPKIIKTVPGRGKTTNGTGFYIKYSEENLKQIFVYLNDSTKININKECNEPGINKECTSNLDLSAYNGKYIEYWFGVSDYIREITPKPTKIFVDITPPEIELNSPEDGEIYTNRKVIFNMGISEPVTLEYMDNSASRPAWRTLCTRCSSYGITSVKTKTFSHGEHELLIRATDNAGNFDEEFVDFEVI